MIPDRCCINPTNALLISSACAVHRSSSRASHSRLRVPTFPAQELRLGNPMAPGRECECWTGTSHQPSQGISAAPFSALSLSHHATADHGGVAVAFGPLVPGRPLLAAPGRPADPSVGELGRSHCGRVIPPESRQDIAASAHGRQRPLPSLRQLRLLLERKPAVRLRYRVGRQ
jgi:hypothetical protein